MKAHSFSPWIAEMYGVSAAVIFQYVEYRWRKAATEKKDYLIYGHRYWCLIRLEDFQRQYPYWREKVIRNAIRRLLKGHKGNPPMLQRIRNCFYGVTGEIEGRKGRHKFDPEMAERYGLTESILLHNLLHWCRHNFEQAKTWIEARQNAEDYDYDNAKASEAAAKKAIEKAWHYVSAEKLLEHHYYVSRATIFRALKHLQECGVLRKKYLDEVRVLRIPSWSFAPRFIKYYHNHPESRPFQEADLQWYELSQSQKGQPESQNGYPESQNGTLKSQKSRENQLHSVEDEPLPERLKAVVVKSGSVGSEELLKAESVADACGSGCAVASAVRQQLTSVHRFAVKNTQKKEENELSKHSPEFRKAFEEYNRLLQLGGGNQVELEKAATRFSGAKDAERDQFEGKASRHFEKIEEGMEGELPDTHQHQTGSYDQHGIQENSTASSVIAAGVAPQASSTNGNGAQRPRQTPPTLRQMRRKHTNQTRKQSEKFDPNDYGDFEPERMRKIAAWEKEHGVHWSCFMKSNSQTIPK